MLLCFSASFCWSKGVTPPGERQDAKVGISLLATKSPTEAEVVQHQQCQLPSSSYTSPSPLQACLLSCENGVTISTLFQNRCESQIPMTLGHFPKLTSSALWPSTLMLGIQKPKEDLRSWPCTSEVPLQWKRKNLPNTFQYNPRHYLLLSVCF